MSKRLRSMMEELSEVLLFAKEGKWYDIHGIKRISGLTGRPLSRN